jgi:Tat protein secretion system quality control protein TatD with DNase activity
MSKKNCEKKIIGEIGIDLYWEKPFARTTNRFQETNSIGKAI